jgi:PAS domain S-box-containing protein
MLGDESKPRAEAADGGLSGMASLLLEGLVGFHRAAPDGTILWANHAELELLGASAEEVVGRSIADFHLDQGVIEDILRRVRAGEVVRAREARLRARDGAIRQVVISAGPVLRDGQAVEILSLTRDDTHRRRLEIELQGSHRNQEIAAELTRSFVAAHFDQQQILKALTTKVAEVLGDACSVALTTEDGILSCRAWAQRDPHGFIQCGGSGARIEDDIGRRAFRTGVSLFIPHIAAPENLLFKAALAVPIPGRGRPIGVVTATRLTQERPYEPNDLRLMEGLGERVGLALETLSLYEKQQRARARSAFLAEASAALSGSLDCRATLTRVAHLAVPRICDWCTVTFLEDGVLRRVAAVHKDPAKAALAQAYVEAFPPTDHPVDVMGGVMANGEPLLISNVTPAVLEAGSQGPEHLELMKKLGVRSCLLVPLTASGQIMGIISLILSDDSRRFEEADRNLAQELSSRAALAIQHASSRNAEKAAKEAVEQLVRRTAQLQTMTNRLAEATTPDHVAQTTLADGLSFLGALGGVFYLVDEPEGLLRHLAHRGYPIEAVKSFSRVPLSEPWPVTDAVRQRQALYFEGREELQDRYPAIPTSGEASAQALVALPLVVKGRVLGVIGLGFTGSRPFDAEERVLLDAISQLAAQAIDRVQLLEAKRRASERTSFLAEASALLSSSLDYETVLSRFASLCVPRLGDWCSIEVVEGEGTRTAAVAHVDPARVQYAQELRRRYPILREGLYGAAAVIRTGQPELYREVTGELLAQTARDDTHLELLRRLNIRSAMVVPMVASGLPIGALTLVWAESDRRYGQEDLHFITEVAHRAALAMENARLFQQAKKAIQLRDDFLSIAGHELKTPLAATLLQVQSLLRLVGRDVTADPRIGDRLGKTEGQLQRLGRLIEELLDVSRIATGRLALEKEPTDLAVLVREVATKLSDAATRNGCALSFKLEEGVVGSWDRLRVEQVLINLLSNAFKYGQERPVEIAVFVDGGRAHITIRDHGIGIDEAHQLRIFERYERAVSERDFGGLGLGLWISRQIMEASGGTLSVESTTGQGATFTMSLPLEPKEAVLALH